MLYKKKGVLFALLIGVLLTGWMTFSLRSDAEEATFDYRSLEEAVLIGLDEQPQLRSPIRTFVAARDQSYTLHFRESMDMDSVNQAIEEQAKFYKEQHNYGIVPTFAFSWINDQELHLTAAVPPGVQKPGEPDRSYVIDVSGAVTKSGNRVKEAPNFTALLSLPKQLWRVAVDGKTMESLTRIKQPHDLELLDQQGRYLLLSRHTEYCGCDKDYQKLYSIYDTGRQVETPYPVELNTLYAGPGNFVADKRGFFYAELPQNAHVPREETAVSIDVKNHVYGAIFSQDRSSVIMLVEDDQSEETDKLIIQNLATGKQQVIDHINRGKVDKKTMQVRFTDDGDSVYFTMHDTDELYGEYREIGYQYSWRTNQLKPWVSPVHSARGVFLSASSDRAFRLHADGGIYRGSERVNAEDAALDMENAFWLQGTDWLADIVVDDQSKAADLIAGTQENRDLILYDARRREQRVLLNGLPYATRVVGTSGDGKWIYLSTDADLHQYQT